MTIKHFVKEILYNNVETTGMVLLRQPESLHDYDRKRNNLTAVVTLEHIRKPFITHKPA